MKIILQKTDSGEEEIIIRYREMTRKISDVVKLFSDSDSRMAGTKDDARQVYYFAPEDVYYFETVEGVAYAYLEKEVYRLREKLEEIVYRYGELGIARCTRTMAVNLYKVDWLKSQPGGRILAALKNGEKVVISRKYAETLREQLRRGSPDVER
jgi:DNA-binding LytR/AlgR family response regulator